MKVSVSKSKNTTIFYLSKSVRIDGKVSTRTVEKIGSYEEIKKICGDMDPYDWAKEYARKKTEEEKSARKTVIIRCSTAKQIPKGEKHLYNAGSLFTEAVCSSLGIPQICDAIAEKHRFKFDLGSIFTMLVSARILEPSSKLSSLEASKKFFNRPDCTLEDVYRALSYLSEENDFIQAELYKRSQKVIERNKSVLYYDCTNYYFEIEQEDDFRKFGHSKENRPNPIVQMGLFMDADGIPLAFSVFDGNRSEQPSLTPLEKKILKDYGLNKFIVCTDAGLASTANRRFNDTLSRKFITTQSIKILPAFLQDFCLGEEGWHLAGSSKLYKLSELDPEKDYDKVFSKDRWINEKGLEQHLIVTFSLKLQSYQRTVRGRQILRARKYIDHPASLNHNRPNDARRFVTAEHCTDDGEIAGNQVYTLDKTLIEKERRYDGFYAVCTNLEDDVNEIVNINRHRWQIEECFRIMKTEFKARPVYLQRKDRITAHFMTCVTALIVYRIIEKKLKNKYTCEEIIDALRGMYMEEISGEGFRPIYSRTDLTDDLHEAFGFRTDYEITTQRDMKKICTKVRKR